jgi:hypothetical protein
LNPLESIPEGKIILGLNQEIQKGRMNYESAFNEL